MVDFVPGIRTRSASPGRTRPGSMSSTVTSGSFTNGSRSSKLAIRFKRGTAILNAPPGRVEMSMISSAGRRHASANQGRVPRSFHPVRAAISAAPSAKRVGSPRNLLTRKALMRAWSSLARTAWVPTNCAITPPRSMSPTITTGRFAASAKPIFAMSPCRKFISAGLPAPSTKTRSRPARRRLKLSRTRGISLTFVLP